MSITPISPPLTLERIQQQFKQDPVLELIQKNLPAAFVQASPAVQKDYCDALLRCQRAKANLQKLLKPLQGLTEFATPLLSQALDRRFGPGLEVNRDTLFHVMAFDSGAIRSSTSVTLLEAALHNFERKEAQTDGFARQSALCKGNTSEPHPKHIKPEHFADLCRHLNLGRKYQDHLDSVLQPDAELREAPDAARVNARATFMVNDMVDMEVCARASVMRNTISEAAYQAVLALSMHQAQPMFNGEPLRLSSISLLEQEIPRVVLIAPQRAWTFTQAPHVLYIPQDPVCPMKEFSSLSEVENELRSRLMNARYRKFFARFIGERNRAAFFTRLSNHLFPMMPIDGKSFSTGLRRPTPDHSANLIFDTEVIAENLFRKWYQQQVFLIRDNARFLAVPTEDEDAESRRQRLQYWLNLGLNIANAASFFVPVLGQMMFVYASVELVGEVYHGLEDLSHGELEQGLDHLMGAAANIAFMVALGKAASGAELPEPPPITSNQFTGKLIPVTLRNGQTRLWKPDLTPFQSSVRLPEGVTTDLNGIVEHEGKHYLELDDQRYQVQHQPALNKWLIKHPNERHPFAPVLQHNEAGAFRLEGEKPQSWAKDRLFKRLGHSVKGLSDSAAERVLRVTDADPSLLLQIHLQQAVPPGQLTDTLKRFQLDRTLESFVAEPGNTRAEAFERLYAQGEVSTDPHVLSVRRDFPSLPTSVAEELIATALPAERQQWLDSARLPLRVAEAAAWHLRQTRLNRALESFYLKSVVNPDTETLSLRLLEKLPGWSDQVRLEVRQGSVHGALLEGIGPVDAPELKYLVKAYGSYQAFDARGHSLNSVPREGNNLAASILHALPDEPRRLIGFSHVARGPELNEALALLATGDRVQAARLLGQPPDNLTFNSPRRLKEGRLGYPLSGRGWLEGFILEEHLLDKIRLLELENVDPQEVLTRLRNAGLSSADVNARLDILLTERQQLQASLNNWAQESAWIQTMSPLRALGRARIGEAILHHWQSSSVPLPASASAVLRLDSVALADFPLQLPDFYYSRVERLELIDAVLYIDPPPFTQPFTPDYLDLFERFIRQFRQTTSLTISRVPSVTYRLPHFQDLPRIIASHLPNLRSLSLINQSLFIQSEVFERLSTLEHLEELDLSGNNYTLIERGPIPLRLSLRRLVLNRIGLVGWPVWLEALVAADIGEISLADNAITQLPPQVLSNPHNAARTTRLVLRGNLLSRRTVIQVSLQSVGAGRAFSFDIDVPADLQSLVDGLLTEQTDLQRALLDWTQASSSQVLLREETLRSREQTAESVMEHWRHSVSERATLPIHLDSIALEDFPQLLPETFYQNAHGLELRNVRAEPEQLARFLRRFQALSSLDITDHAPQLTAPPAVLAELPNLRELGLTDNNMLVDQSAIEFLSRLPTLVHLDLSGNRMGTIVDSQVLRDHYWHSLTLDNVGLQHWPEWLNELIPGSISSLSLNRNQLTELPEGILANPRNVWAHTEISLEGNPLSRDTMIVAHERDHGNQRSYSFYMDYPEDILQMPTERHATSESSDSDSDLSEQGDGIVSPDVSGSPDVELWLSGTLDVQAAHRAIWEQLERAGDASMFMRLIGRLHETADYQRTREALVPRVWAVLQAAANDAELRALLNGMAQDAVVQRTCGDGIRLEFNQMEVQVYTRQSLHDIPDAERGQTLYRLMSRLYRLDEVDRLARSQQRVRDEAEVRLAYRLGLATRLDLPLPPQGMLYRAVASVTSEELRGVEEMVLNSQGSDAFFSAAATREFWTAYLRETYADEFATLKATFEQRQQLLEDEYPELNDEYLARIKALDAERREQEQNLIKQLTHREGLKYGE
jgi:Leucine-rich repeat (LRR) protein